MALQAEGVGRAVWDAPQQVRARGLMAAVAAPPGQATLPYVGVFASCGERRGLLDYSGWCARGEPAARETKWSAAA